MKSHDNLGIAYVQRKPSQEWEILRLHLLKKHIVFHIRICKVIVHRLGKEHCKHLGKATWKPAWKLLQLEKTQHA